MNHIADFSIEISQVGDRYVAEIDHASSLDCPEAVFSPVVRESVAMTKESSRYFALKSFCAEIGDTLRAYFRTNMHTITDHKVNGLNEALILRTLDEPGCGGANHQYLITLDAPHGDDQHWRINFQNGPIQEAGLNGLSNEVLLAVVIDRMRGFQSGQFACRDNAVALTKLEEALMWLQKRTRGRVARGVEGTNKM